MASVVVEPGIPVIAPGLFGLLKPPAGLLARARWVFLLVSLMLAAVFGIAGTLTSANAGLPWPLVVVATVALAGSWLYGYRQGRFSLVTDGVCVVALLALSASLPDQRFMQYATSACIWMRALHSSVRQSAIGAVLYVAAFVAGFALSPAGLAVEGPIVIGRTIVVGALFTAVFSLVGTVLSTYERAISREKRLRVASHALAEASGRQDIYAAAISGARGLLAGTDEFGVEVAVGSEEDMEVVGAAGEGAETVKGARLHAHDLPDALREALHDGRPFEVAHAEPQLFNALDFAPRHGSGSVFGLPLVAHGKFEGALVIASHAALDDELKDDLQTLGDLTALAIESQTLLETGGNGTTVAPSAGTGEPGTALPFDRAWDGTRETAVVRKPLWQLPHDLPERVRWLFLACAIVMALWVGVVSLFAAVQGTFTPLQLVAILAPVWLGAWWVYGYRRGSFPLAGDVVVGVLLGVLLFSSDSFVTVQPVLFASILVRSAHGSARNVALAVATYIAALLAAIALSPGRGAGLIDPISRVLLPFAMCAIAGAVYLLTATLRRYARALARERTLRVAGALLVAATDRSHVHAAVLDGAASLLSETPGGAAIVAVGPARSGQAPVDSDDMEVVAAVGGRAAHARGRAIHLRDLPEALRATLHAGDPADVPHADAAVWPALDLEGAPAAVYAVPLHARGALEGAMVVGSDGTIDAELKDDLQTLAALAALALEDVVLAESRS